MDELRRRITEDLAGQLEGEVRCDPIAVELFSSDASLFQVSPLGVVFPRNHDDVVTIARYAQDTGIPISPRGAGTGLTGASLGPGLIIDFSRHMNQIVSESDARVRVQAGVVGAQLHQYLSERGRYFPPDPSSIEVTTIGSMLAIDAAGSHSVRVGSTRDHVENIQLVLASGESLSAGTESLDFLSRSNRDGNGSTAGNGSNGGQSEHSTKRNIVSHLAKLLEDNAPLIERYQPPLVRNTCGYFLRGVRTNDRLHLQRLMVGSEGTLGLFTSATLLTAPLPAHRGVVLLLFGNLEQAVRAVQAVTPQQPSACDLLDRRLLNLARESDPRFEELIAPASEAAVIVEQIGFSDTQVRNRLRMVVQAVYSAKCSAIVAMEAYTPRDVEFLWSLPRTVVPLLSKLKGETRPIPLVEDMAVPADKLHEYLIRSQRVLQKFQVTASLYAHAAAGQVHMRPFLPAITADNVQRVEDFAGELYSLVWELGGSISGEHGDGLSRSSFVRRQYGELFPVFQQIKELFDPHNLLNPGKIVSAQPNLPVDWLRPQPQAHPELVHLQLNWTPQEMLNEASNCNGCGSCRTLDPATRMCPVFRNAPLEDASPRAKANVMRSYGIGHISPATLRSPEMKALADLCFNCKQCQLECPTNVDIPHLMIEAKAAGVEASGLTGSDWILSRAHSFGTLGCTLSLAINWAIESPQFRWLAEKLLGIAQKRKLPLFARRPFLMSMHRSLRTPPSTIPRKHKPVIYFVDYYANYHDPDLARAFVAVLQHNGIPVHVPPGQQASGMAMISVGDLAAARVLAEHNLRELADFAREGCPIVCTEPAAAICLTQEYPAFVEHPDVKVVADRTIEAGAFLTQLFRESRLRTDFAPLPLKVGYHTPCHLKALNQGTPLFDLLSLIPELEVDTIDEGCSGMAGAYGLSANHFQTSVQVGWNLISRMRSSSMDAGTTECSSCKMQMEQGTLTPTIHPIKLLALAYGLLPELRQSLKPSRQKLVVT